MPKLAASKTFKLGSPCCGAALRRPGHRKRALSTRFHDALMHFQRGGAGALRLARCRPGAVVPKDGAGQGQEATFVGVRWHRCEEWLEFEVSQMLFQWAEQSLDRMQWRAWWHTACCCRVLTGASLVN